MPPVAPVTGAVLPERSNIEGPLTVETRERRVDVGRRADARRVERSVDALGEAGEHFAGADLVDVGDAVSGHVGNTLAPAHGAGDLLDEALSDLIGIADRLCQHVGDDGNDR